MKKLILVGIMVVSLFSKTLSYNEVKRDFNRLTDVQVETLISLFMYAKKDDLSYSAAAIAWKRVMLEMFYFTKIRKVLMIVEYLGIILILY